MWKTLVFFMQREEMVMCILLLFNHLPNANAHTKCLFVSPEVRKVEIWTKMDGLISHSSFILL